jgi:hypothetical protein
VYVKGTVKAVPSGTTITVKGEGYEDSVPVDNIISTIRQSAESVKIKASQIEIDGTTKFTNGSTVTTVGDYVGGVANDAVKSLEIGGKNLYRSSTTVGPIGGTATLSAYDASYHGRTLTVTAGTPTLRFSNIIPQTNVPYTISFTLTSSVATTAKIDVMDNTVQSFNVPSGTSKVVCTSTPTRAIDSTYHFVDIVFGTTGIFKLADIMIEQSTIASDWAPAPEELPKPNLTPFFSFEPYNTTAGQGGQYWNSFTYPANFTAMGDGWVKYVTRDNTSGTATAYDQYRPKHINALSPDTTYTLMVEFRNVSKTGNVYLRCPDGGQTNNSADYIYVNGVKSTMDTLIANGVYYKQFRTATTTQSNYDVFFGLCTRVDAGAKATYEMRLSLYEGVYFGPYQPYAGHAVLQEQRVYYSTTATSAPAAPTSWVTATGTANLTWTTKRMQYDKTNKYLYTTMQRKYADGTTSCGPVLLDDTTTVIDGGNIITGSIATNRIDAGSGTFSTANIPNLDAAKITSGSISADRIKANVINAVNNGNGTINADKINVSNINIGSLAGSIGGRNLLLDTGTAKTSSAFALNSSNYAVWDVYSLYVPYNQIVKVDDLITVSFD